jgi:hypothetical protein
MPFKRLPLKVGFFAPWIWPALIQPVIVDLRNIYRADEMRRAAFHYVPIGRARVE